MQAAARDTTTQILRTAARHFARKGLAGARVDEIAAEAGVNKATIYYHLGNKQALYQTLLADSIEAMHQRVSADVVRAGDPESKLRAYIDAVAAHMQGDYDYFPGMMMREVLNGAANLPDQLLTRMNEVKDVLAGIIQDGVAAGLFRDANPYMTHMLIIGTLTIYATSEPLRQRINTLHNDNGQEACPPEMPLIVAQVTDMILHSLKRHRDGGRAR